MSIPNCLEANLSENLKYPIWYPKQPSQWPLSQLKRLSIPPQQTSLPQVRSQKKRNITFVTLCRKDSKKASSRNCKMQAFFPEFGVFPVFLPEWFSRPWIVRKLCLQELKSSTLFLLGFENYSDYASPFSLVRLHVN